MTRALLDRSCCYSLWDCNYAALNKSIVFIVSFKLFRIHEAGDCNIILSVVDLFVITSWNYAKYCEIQYCEKHFSYFWNVFFF